LENVLIDQNCKWLTKDENRKFLKNYEEIFVVGEDIKQRSFDENCASFCLDRNCDFLTADGTAHIHFFKIKKIKSIQISEFIYEKKADRHIYLVKTQN